MKRFCVFIVLLLSFTFSTLVKADEIDPYLDSLDVEVAQYQKYDEQKEKELTRLRQNFQAASLDLDKYLCSKQLVNAYMRYNSDSTDHYARVCLNLAIKTNNRDWRNEAILFSALSYATRSSIIQARETIETCDNIESLPDPLKRLYAKTQLEIMSHVDRMTVSEKEYYEEFAQMWSVYSKYLVHNSPEYYYYEVFKDIDGKKDVSLLKGILSSLKRIGGKPTIGKSLLENCAFVLIHEKGDDVESMKHLIQLAITNIKLSNKDDGSLLLIANIIEGRGDNHQNNLQRQLSYIRLSSKNVRDLRDFGRSLWLIMSQSKIHESNRVYTEKQLRNSHILNLVLIVLLLTALVGVFVFWREQKKVKSSHNKQDKEYQSLLEEKTKTETTIQKLQKEIETLKEAIARRDSGYLDGIMLNVKVISKTKERIQKMHNLAAVKKWQDVYRMLSNDVIDDDDYKEISKSLDKIILTVIPDFVEKFNTLIKPEAQIKLEDPKTLTPGLRIYGLIALGMTDMGSIADILHYSSQTIYNYRLKIKKSAVVPEKQFDNAVAALFQK